jgi:hypothetical protein
VGPWQVLVMTFGEDESATTWLHQLFGRVQSFPDSAAVRTTVLSMDTLVASCRMAKDWLDAAVDAEQDAHGRLSRVVVLYGVDDFSRLALVAACLRRLRGGSSSGGDSSEQQLLDDVWSCAKGHVAELRPTAPSQLRYLKCFASASSATHSGHWPPPKQPLELHSVLLRLVPVASNDQQLASEMGLRVHGCSAHAADSGAPLQLLFSQRQPHDPAAKAQEDVALLKVEAKAAVAGDVVLECFHAVGGVEAAVFTAAFHTSQVATNLLMLAAADVDVHPQCARFFKSGFRVELLFKSQAGERPRSSLGLRLRRPDVEGQWHLTTSAGD